MEKIRHHSRNYCSKWRRSKLGKTKPNHVYFARLIKKETEDFLRENKNYLLTYKPETYYAMKNQKLPKKYQKKQRINIAPVNAFVPHNLNFLQKNCRNKWKKKVNYKRKKKQKLMKGNKLCKKKRRESKGTKKLLHVKEDIFIFVIRMSQLIKIGLGIQK